MHKTAIVFGATGLTGKELVFELLEDARFEKVKAVVRQNLTLSHPKLEQIIVRDFILLDQQRQQFTGDVFFCCIGTTIKKAGSQAAFLKIDLDIPIAIATLALVLSVPSLVVISSIGASAESSNFYLQTKGIMEQQVAQVYSGNLKFVRPSFLLGSRSEFRIGEKIAAVLAPLVSIFLMGSLRKYHAIHSWDVARGMINASEMPKDKSIIESDELQALADKTHKPKHKAWL